MNYIQRNKNFIQFKYFLMTLLTFSLLIVALPLSARASEISGISWDLSGGTLTVSGDGAMPDFNNANLPPWYDQREAIQKVIISNEVLSVGNYAFYECKNLSQISFGSGIQKIGISAFEGCEEISSISFPESLGTIDYHAFYGCTSLTSIYLPYNTTNLGKGVFAYCTGLVTATIDGPVTVLPAWTFYGCTSLKTVNLPDTLSDIGEDAFENVPVVEDMYEQSHSQKTESSKTDILESDISKSEVQTPIENVPQIPESTEQIIPTAPEENIQTPNEKESNTQTVVQSSTNIVAPKEDVQVTHDYFERPHASVSSTVKKIQEGSPTYGLGEVKPNGRPKDIYIVDLYVIIEDMSGWDEVISKVADFAKYPERLSNDNTEVSTVQIIVELKEKGLKVSAEFLKALAGLPAKITFHNPSGMIWSLQCKDYDVTQISKDFLLDYEVGVLNDKSKDQKAITGFQSTYEIKFQSNCPLKFSINLPVGISYMNYDATLYKKEDHWKRLQLSKVDHLGNTEFYLDSVKKSDKYMFFLDVSSPYGEEALIPESMQQGYGGLMDEFGNKYAITGSNSSWGMSGLQVTLIMVAVIIGTILTVGVTVGIISRKKYAKLDSEYYVKHNKT